MGSATEKKEGDFAHQIVNTAMKKGHPTDQGDAERGNRLKLYDYRIGAKNNSVACGLTPPSLLRAFSEGKARQPLLYHIAGVRNMVQPMNSFEKTTDFHKPVGNLTKLNIILPLYGQTSKKLLKHVLKPIS